MYCLLRLWTAQRCLRCCCRPNQYFKYMQNEKLIQMLFLFLLFFGMITGFMDKIIYAVLSLFGGMIGLM